jgi:hypothetical protein
MQVWFSDWFSVLSLGCVHNLLSGLRLRRAESQRPRTAVVLPTFFIFYEMHGHNEYFRTDTY